jgi:hypothetical protein
MLGAALLFRQIKKPRQLNPVIRDLLPLMISLLARFRRSCQAAFDAGQPLAGFEGLDAAVKRYRQETEEFLRHWPWGSHDLAPGWEAAYERGEFLDAREALDELLRQADARGEGQDRVVGAVRATDA